MALDNSGEILARVSGVFFALTEADTNDEMMALEAKIAPFCASSEDKEQVPTAHGIKGLGGVCFSFPLASTCNLQADSLYLCSRRATRLFALYFALMTNKTM